MANGDHYIHLIQLEFSNTSPTVLCRRHMDYRYPGGTLRRDCNTINYTNGKYIFKFNTIHNTMHNGRVQIYVIVTVRRYTFTVSLQTYNST